jgi:hypothetical protein
MSGLRRILADYNEKGVYVYQAFTPAIVRVAVEKDTFGQGFGLDRMTWIKPSFGWMLHRSGYASKHNQEAIARIHLSHEGFQEILGQAVLTSYNPAFTKPYANEIAWKDALRRSEVRCQWDPDRTLRDGRLERRAIQLGLSGSLVRRYVNEWILGVEDVTPLAHAVALAKQQREDMPTVPEEREYPISPELQIRLGYD